MKVMYNCHVHLFTAEAVHSAYLPLSLARVARSRVGSRIGRFVLRTIWPLRSMDRLDRIAAVVDIGSLPSQKAVLQHVMGFYPQDTRFVALPLDMDYMKDDRGTGKPPQDYLSQLDELRSLKAETAYEEVLIPFVCADPRRPDVFEVVKTYLEEYGFGGIKLYPPLGYYPFDERLGDVYAYAQDHQIPIVTHCTRGGVYYKGTITQEMRAHPKTGEHLPERRHKHFTDHYTDPRNYEYVLDKYEDLKLCVAHYGGEDEWHRYLNDPWPNPSTRESWLSVISGLIRNHRNVYADISFTAHNERFWPLIKVLMNTDGLRDKIIYGSDFYVVRKEVTEREFSLKLRAAIGEDEYRKMAVANAQSFLGVS